MNIVVRWLGRSIAVLIAVVAAVLALVPWLVVLGFVTSPPGPFANLKPTDDATLSVAGATLFLAVFTALLASYTRESVAEGRRERLVTERALEASWRPILVDVPPGRITDADWVRRRVSLQKFGEPLQFLQARIPLRNIGSGPAFVLSSSLSIGDYEPKSVIDTVFYTTIVAPKEQTELVFKIPTVRKDLSQLLVDLQREGENRPPWLVKVSYSDQAGSNNWRTEVHIRAYGIRSWYVELIALKDDKTSRVVAMSGTNSPPED